MRESNNSWVTNAVLIASVLVSLWLSASAMQARNQFVDSKAVDLNSSSGLLNPFLLSAGIVDAGLASQAAELRARLGYMVFRKERTEIQQNLRGVLHAQLNQYPFNSQAWRDLVFVQQGLPIVDKEYAASFKIAKSLSRWHIEQRIALLNRCVMDGERLQAISDTLCADLLSNIPLLDDRRRLANMMGVSYKRLNAFLEAREAQQSVLEDEQ